MKCQQDENCDPIKSSYPTQTFDDVRPNDQHTLAEYKECIAELNRLKADIPFSNGMKEHAAAIMEEFFRSARKRVVVFCHNLQQDAYESQNVFESLVGAVLSGVHVDIITQEEPQSVKIKEFAEIAKNAKWPLRLVRSKDNFQKQLTQNFAVMDNRAYRWEPNWAEPKASACMNDPDKANQLMEVFEHLMKKNLATS
ncbi:MAG: hypothetical protein JJU29_09690 [Verrucomicrobia bacterium]|nr:hypothetical protein [Verrucomicrobiota bacterium]MCH8511536.1 hypothetical protein [Kiritimatiellia bacterium]